MMSFGAQWAGKEATGACFCAQTPDRLAAVAAIFGRQHQLLLVTVEIAFRPAIVGALLESHQFFGGQVRALFRL